MEAGALIDLKVIELTDGVAGPYCGRLFASMGADVIKIETPSGGDKTRHWGPFPEDRPHCEKSGIFLYLNAGKKSITLNLAKRHGRDLLIELLQGADILIENYPPPALKNHGLEYDTLQAVNSSLIMVSILPFGYRGHQNSWKGEELIAWMAGGLGYYVPTLVKQPAEEPPIKLPGHNIEINTALVAGAAAMLALFLRKIRARGQFVDISMQDVVANMAKMELIGITYNALKPSRLLKDTLLPLTAEKVKDGYVYFMYFTEDSHWRATQQMIGDPEWARDKQFDTLYGRLQRIHEIRDRVNTWLIGQGKWAISEKAQKLGIPCAPVLNVKEAFKHRQGAERGFFTAIEHPLAGEIRFPGALGWLSKTPCQFSPAPLLGQHNQTIYAERLGYTRQQVEQLREKGVI